MNCPNCGQPVLTGTRFCGNCGAEIKGEDNPPLAPDSGTIIDREPVPYLLIAAGAGRGQAFDLRGEVRLGRSRANAITLADGKVSRNHARLDPVRSTYILTDLGSANGTFVNGVRITQPVRLRDGDLLQVGDTQLVFYARPSAHPPQADHAAVLPIPPAMPAADRGPDLSNLPLPAGPGRKWAPWIWIGCGVLLVVIILLVIVAVMTGFLIGQGLGGA